jgi:branched-chain amino acid transport system substrate-binding protein
VTDANLHLVPIDYDRALSDEYLPAQLTAEDYPHLIARNEPLDTIATDAILASYNWPPGSERYRRLSRLVEALFSRMAELQQPPFHPKWRELAPRATVAGWTRFRPAQDWVDRNAAPGTPVAILESRDGAALDHRRALLRQVLEERASTLSVAGQDRDAAVFRELLGLQASPLVRR